MKTRPPAMADDAARSRRWPFGVRGTITILTGLIMIGLLLAVILWPSDSATTGAPANTPASAQPLRSGGQAATNGADETSDSDQALANRLEVFRSLPAVWKTDRASDSTLAVMNKVFWRWHRITTDNRYLYGVIDEAPGTLLADAVVALTPGEDFVATNHLEARRGSTSTDRTIDMPFFPSPAAQGAITIHVKLKKEVWLITGLKNGTSPYGNIS